MLGSVLAVALLLIATDVHARDEVVCAAAWSSADANGDGFITRDEGSRYLALIGVGDQSIADGRLSHNDFMRHCLAGLFDALHKTNEAAPLTGANSFTERDAKERVLGRGYRNVSPLQKDADGIWRGTAELNGIKVDVAVDYKGNVVSK